MASHLNLRSHLYSIKFCLGLLALLESHINGINSKIRIKTYKKISNFIYRIPTLHPNSSTPDQAKLEKKRERNRIAASKCRQRKLEKIQVLEEQVFNLKKENEQLRRSYERLRESLEKSNAQIDFHRRNGCSIDNSTSREVRKTSGSL